MELLDRASESGLPDEGAAPGPSSAPKLLAPADARVRSYEDLDGAEGRAVYFRPQRFTAEELAPLKCTVTVSHGGVTRECALLDVSQSGVAFSWPLDVALATGASLQRVCLRFDGHEAYRGEVRIGSIRAQAETALVGASFAGFLLDVNEILELRRVRAFEAKLRAGEQPWAVSGNYRFKALVTELRLYLDEARECLGKLERELPWHVLQGQPSAARTALIARLRGDFASDVVRYTEQIDEALREADGASSKDREALRQYSRRQVDAILMEAPWMHRARFKPFGYPGDYEVMNFVYERPFEGPTLFAKALSLAFLQTKAALAVRYRKDLMKRQLRAAIESRAGRKEPVRILSIAAGPAQELYELLSEIDDLPVRLEIVLFDQDKSALAHAYSRLRPVIASRWQGRVNVVFLNESIKRLLRDATLFSGFDKFDYVYSVGLFDYLQPLTATRLAKNLFGTTAPGGAVYIANMVDHDGRWFMEQHLEWTLLYRSREELRAIGHRAAPEARLRILEEETGVNPFIELQREG